MLKVWIRSGECSAIAATIELESMPPDRNAPSGTSLISRLFTAREKRSRKPSTASSSESSSFGS